MMEPREEEEEMEQLEKALKRQETLRALQKRAEEEAEEL